jgi:hypothetical protein
MKTTHAEKTTADKNLLRNRREELEAFKDAENQEIPAAERLEDFARIEISRAIKELDDCCAEMEKARLDYAEMKADTDAFENANSSTLNRKGREAQLKEMKELVVIAESRLKDTMGSVDKAMEGLQDAEALLERARRIKRQQDELLPLFQLMAGGEALPSRCQLSSCVVSLIILMKGTFEQKYNFLVRLFDPFCDDAFTAPIISDILIQLQKSLHLLRFIPFRIESEEIVNIVHRGFLSFQLNPAKDHFTEYETKQFIRTVTSHSHLLCKVFGVTSATLMSPGAITFEPAGASSNMSTFQRNKMAPLTLLTLGLINSNICKVFFILL